MINTYQSFFFILFLFLNFEFEFFCLKLKIKIIKIREVLRFFVKVFLDT